MLKSTWNLTTMNLTNDFIPWKLKMNEQVDFASTLLIISKWKEKISDESSPVCDFCSLSCHRIKDSSTFDPSPSHCIDFLCCRSRIDDYINFCRNDEEQLYTEEKISHTGKWIHWLNLKFYSIEKLKTNKLISNSKNRSLQNHKNHFRLSNYRYVDQTRMQTKSQDHHLRLSIFFFRLCFPLNSKRKWFLTCAYRFDSIHTCIHRWKDQRQWNLICCVADQSEEKNW